MADTTGWRIRFAGLEWDHTQATIGHLGLIQETFGLMKWDALDPTRSPRHAMAWITVLLASEKEISIDEAMLLVMAAPIEELVTAVLPSGDDEEGGGNGVQ